MSDDTGDGRRSRARRLKGRALLALVIGGLILLFSGLGAVQYLLFGSLQLNPRHHGLEGGAARNYLLIQAGAGALLWLYSVWAWLRARNAG